MVVTVDKQRNGDGEGIVKQSACFKGTTDVPLRSKIVSTLMECNISEPHTPLYAERDRVYLFR